MSIIRKSLVTAAVLAAVGGVAQAQTTSTQAERDRGVPGVDVDVGRNARGAVDVNRDTTRRERDRGVPGVDVDVGRNASGAVDVDRTTRAPRADRG